MHIEADEVISSDKNSSLIDGGSSGREEEPLENPLDDGLSMPIGRTLSEEEKITTPPTEQIK